MQKHLISTIKVNEKGNTHFGDLAHKVLYKEKSISIFPLTEHEKIFVFLDAGSKDLQCWIGLESEKGLDIFIDRKNGYVKENQLLIVRL